MTITREPQTRVVPTEDFNALYFPDIRIRDPVLIRSALLLWDNLFFVAPDPDSKPHDEDTPRDLAHALDVIARPHVPDEAEKTAAHRMIMKIVEDSPRDLWEAAGYENFGMSYRVYITKFHYNTLLQLDRLGLGFFSQFGDQADFSMRTRLGLTVMAVLAACCNGVSHQAVTDRVWDYAKIAHGMPRFPKVGRLRPDYGAAGPPLEDRLMRASFEILDLSRVSISRLIQLRERGDREFNELRHKYVQTMRDFARAMRKYGKEAGQAHAIEAEFIDQGRRWAQELEKVLEAQAAERRLIHLSIAGGAAYPLARLATDPVESAVELLTAFATWCARRIGTRRSARVEIQQSPVGYLHFLSRL